MSKKQETGKAVKAPAPKAKPRPKAKAPAKKTRKPALSEEEALAKAEQKPLLPTEEVFIGEYMKSLNATDAYSIAHPKANRASCRTEGCRTLARPNVAKKIAELRAAQMVRLQLDADEIVRGVHAIAEADHRALSEYRYLCCRHCWGQDFKYQRTHGEMERDRDAFTEAESQREALCLLKDKPYVPREFNEKGGVGFDRWKDPNPECPECAGVGVGTTVINDTRKLPADAVTLYAGMKETKDGIEVLKHDKLRAKDMLFKHLGLYEADNVQQNKTPERSQEELAAMYAAAMEHAERQRAAMMERRKKIEELDAKERFGTAGGQGAQAAPAGAPA